jgi:hypothetical protein
MSFEMTLDNVGHEMIPRIIGQNGKSIKKIISSSWRMYENYQNEGKGVGENKPKLVIKIMKKDEGVSVKIVTESETMRKFAVHSLKTNVKAIVAKSMGNTFRLYAEMPNSCIGMLLGKKAQFMRKDLEDIADEISEDYEPSFGSLAQKTWTKVVAVSCDVTPEFLESIRSSETKSFVGWEPESQDTEVVEILVKTNGLPNNVFLDLVNRLSEKLDERIKRIVSRHQETMSSIEEALQYDDDDNDDNDDNEYSPESPR